jgi:hypothetical protein
MPEETEEDKATMIISVYPSMTFHRGDRRDPRRDFSHQFVVERKANSESVTDKELIHFTNALTRIRMLNARQDPSRTTAVTQEMFTQQTKRAVTKHMEQLPSHVKVEVIKGNEYRDYETLAQKQSYQDKWQILKDNRLEAQTSVWPGPPPSNSSHYRE